MRRCALIPRGTRERGALARWSLALCMLTAGWSGTVAAETYAVLSLIADRFTVVTAEQQIGSNLDRKFSRVVSIAGSALDEFVARIADATIAKSRPDASVTLLRTSDPALYALAKSLDDADVADARRLLSELEGVFATVTDPRLLLIAPLRTDTQLVSEVVHVGAGKASGLGFFIDPNLVLRSERTNAVGRGFLGIFANFQLLLVDPTSGALVAHARVAAGSTHAAADSADARPWNAATDAQKIAMLQALLKSEIERVLPPMLTAK